MSGHSHFSTIKHKKAATDAKRSKIFSKLSRLITMSVKEKGSSLDTNSALKLAIEQAKKANMPSDNIERAIKKGTGELEGEKLEEVTFEAYGPGGTAIIIEGITDNRNRTLGDIKLILTKNNGKMVTGGAIKWMFERKGILEINSSTLSGEKNEIELKIIEAGAENLFWRKEVLEINTQPENLEEVKNNLEEKGISVNSAFLGWIAKEEISISEKQKESNQKLFEDLDENDSIQKIYCNAKILARNLVERSEAH